MKQREAELWGMAQDEPKSSKVRVAVDTVKTGGSEYLGDAQGIPQYAKGILIEPRGTPDDQRRKVLTSGEFDVRIEVLKGVERSEIEKALSAWLLFGGLGSRTRRGFGSLQCDWPGLHTQFSGRCGIEPTSGFTRLLGARLFLASGGNPAACWLKATEALRDFRKGQMPDQPRPNQGPASHSPWPEADSLRMDQNQHPLRGLPNGPSFPRAELGLPLQFRSMQMHTGAFRQSHVPGTSQNDRLASPVIVKPVFWNGSWHAGVLLLSRGRISKPGLNTDATGYPADIYGWPAYQGQVHQKKADVLDAFAAMLKVYKYQAVEIS